MEIDPGPAIVRQPRSCGRGAEQVDPPQKIAPFGSAARGAIDPDSDMDLLVIQDAGDARGLTAQIHR